MTWMVCRRYFEPGVSPSEGRFMLPELGISPKFIVVIGIRLPLPGIGLPGNGIAIAV
jgi:hypothetical protein